MVVNVLSAVLDIRFILITLFRSLWAEEMA
jgi:hypothetical protein